MIRTWRPKVARVSALPWLASLTVLLSFAPSHAQPGVGPAKPLPGSSLFSGGAVRTLRLQLAPGALESLRHEPRTYVKATVQEGTNRFDAVGLHLKGSRGSFRPVDAKPSLTLSFDHFRPGQRFHGLCRVHLNNSLEDSSYMKEKLGAELFHEAGLPAPRVAWALVELNGRKLGLYVLKEGFTEDFLALHFQSPTGDLYEPEEGSDVDGRMKRNLGDGADDRTALQTLADAARDPDLPRRWQRLQRVLDLDRFLSFMALEVLVGHRDGYCLARNNFRVYHDADTTRIQFLPHGMDNLLGNPNLPVQPQMAGLVARGLMETPEGCQHYRERLGCLYTNVLKVEPLTQRIDQWAAEIESAAGRSGARELKQEAGVVKERIAQRAASVAWQLADERQPLEFGNGEARLTSWKPAVPPAGCTLDRKPSPDGRPALRIKAGPVTAASWRMSVVLGRGHYRFEGRARVAAVAPLPFGKNQGAGLRAAGHRPSAPSSFVGDSDWRLLWLEFDVSAVTQEIELVCELRASRGEAWFDLDSLRLKRQSEASPRSEP